VTHHAKPAQSKNKELNIDHYLVITGVLDVLSDIQETGEASVENLYCAEVVEDPDGGTNACVICWLGPFWMVFANLSTREGQLEIECRN